MDAVTFPESKEASSRLAKEKFQAVFLDVHMPRPGGIELAGQMHASGMNRSTPIVIITGEDDRSALTDAFNAGANFFLYKPIDRHRLLRLIRVAQGPIQREARRYERVKDSCKVTIERNQEHVSGMTLDLSLGGMFLQASRTLPLGSVVQILLELKLGAHPLTFPRELYARPPTIVWASKSKTPAPKKTKTPGIPVAKNSRKAGLTSASSPVSRILSNHSSKVVRQELGTQSEPTRSDSVALPHASAGCRSAAPQIEESLLR
jgi:CheY-like chemotaxis protein